MSHNSGRATGSRKEKCTHTKGARRQKRGWAERSSDATGRPKPAGDSGPGWDLVLSSPPLCSNFRPHVFLQKNPLS